jgi:hypothetical protein
MRVGACALCLIIGTMLAAGVRADDARSAEAAKKKAKACNAQATEHKLQGDELTAYLRSCIASEGPVTARQEPVSRVEKEKQCNALANSRTLTGAERDAFVRSCIAGQ